MFIRRSMVISAASAFFLALTIAINPAAASPATEGRGDMSGRPLSAHLTGAAEVSNGDPDGHGHAMITLNQGQGRVCFHIVAHDIATVTAAHIHGAVAGANGPVKVDFGIAVNGMMGCVTADAELIKAIRQNPTNYYVNVHTAEFPGGAIRGQLSK